MGFCTVAIQHTSGEVREEAEKIIIELYKDEGAPVKTFLPPDDDKTRRNVLYKQLFEAFDRIDGKPSKEDLRVGFEVHCPVVWVLNKIKGCLAQFPVPFCFNSPLSLV